MSSSENVDGSYEEAGYGPAISQSDLEQCHGGGNAVDRGSSASRSPTMKAIDLDNRTGLDAMRDLEDILRQITPFTKSEAREVASSEKSGRAQLSSGNKYEDGCYQLLSWNIGDGPTKDRQIVISLYCEAAQMDLFMLQECTWKPHSTSIANKHGGQYPTESVNEKFAKKFGLPNSFKANFTSDNGRWIVTAFDDRLFENLEIPAAVFNLRDSYFDNAVRTRVCISYMQERNFRGRKLILVNCHTPCKDIDKEEFCESFLKFVHALCPPDDQDHLLCDGVIFGGDFNMDLSLLTMPHNATLLVTAADSSRKQTIDWLGYVSRSGCIYLSDHYLVNWTAADTNPESLSVDLSDTEDCETGKLLNHPIVTALVKVKGTRKVETTRTSLVELDEVPTLADRMLGSPPCSACNHVYGDD